MACQIVVARCSSLVLEYLNDTFGYVADLWCVQASLASYPQVIHYQCVPICTEWWCTEANEATQTHCYIPVARLVLFGHIMRMDDNADAKRILLASPPADWRRQLGRSRITWLSTVQQDLKQHHLALPEAADLAQNRPLWRMMLTYGATQSWVACQKWRRRRSYSCDRISHTRSSWLSVLYVLTAPRLVELCDDSVCHPVCLWAGQLMNVVMDVDQTW